MAQTLDPSTAWGNLIDSTVFSHDDSFHLLEDFNFDVDLDYLSLPQLEDSSEEAQLIGSDSSDTFSRVQESSIVAQSCANLEHMAALGHHEDTSQDTATRQPTTAEQLCESATMTDPNSDKSPHPKKRKWLESVFVFSADKDVKVAVKKRKPFSPHRRKEVAFNRQLGACLQCKIGKGPCNFGLPCDRCIRRAGSISLGQEICTRQSLVATRFNNVDIFRAAYIEQKLKALDLPSSSQSCRTVYIGFPPINDGDLTRAFIELPVISYETSSEPATFRIITYDYYGSKAFDAPRRPLALCSNAPSPIEKLIQSYKISVFRNSACSGPFQGFQGALVAFAERYCITSNVLPLKVFLADALRMRYLFNVYRQISIMKERPEDSDCEYTPHTITLQLKSLIIKEIAQLEFKILSEIDELIRGSKTTDNANALAVWVCLWIVILSYRDNLSLQRACILCLDPTDREDPSPRYYLTRHIFNALTSAYAALYKTTSPLNFDFRKEEISQVMDQDPKLIRLLCTIKTELFWFQAGKDLIREEDALFKTMVIDNESKLTKAHIKEARRRGLL